MEGDSSVANPNGVNGNLTNNPATSSTSTTPTTRPTPTSSRLNQNPDRRSAHPNNNNNNNNNNPANNASTTNPARPTVTQPKPQALPKRTGPSSIIVSPRQKGNPVLSAIKSVPWEYGDIPADYLLGLTTCALFLSLKYHRLHPEYIYTRIKALQGKYALRIVLVMVDIPNHEESLRELSKTSLINNVTLILCWSAAEGGRYLELFKTYENAAPTAIRSHQSSAYADRMMEFITLPRSVNKTDAVSLVSQFGSLRRAVNAGVEEVGGIAGWGEKKVVRWCQAVREPFRVRRAGRRGVLGREGTGLSERVDAEDAGLGSGREGSLGEGDEMGRSTLRRSESGSRDASESRPRTADADRRPKSRLAEQVVDVDDVDDSLFLADEEAMAEAMTGVSVAPPKKAVESTSVSHAEMAKKRKAEEEPVSEGIMAALSKLRKEGG